MTWPVWGMTLVAGLALVIALIEGLVIVGSTLALFLFLRKTHRSLNDIAHGLEQAFHCRLLGPSPYMNILEWNGPGDKVWLIPYREQGTKDKKE